MVMGFSVTQFGLTKRSDSMLTGDHRATSLTLLHRLIGPHQRNLHIAQLAAE
jgi:hypothetical protein